MTVLILKMLCACSGQPLESGSIIDLERVITEYAWRELKRDSRWYNCLRRQDFAVDVPWNFFEFDHRTTRFQLRAGKGEGGYREKKQVELFRTDFTNSTNKDQVYKLRTQRQTKAATTVAIQKGFTLKGNTNFKLKIPAEIGHFGVSASTDGYLRVCRPRGETFEDIFTWQVDSDVTVEPKHVTNARLLVTEDELVADFEVRTSMRMPTGEAPIIVRRKMNKEIYAVLMISDLREVFADVECNILNISKPDSDSKKPRYAIEFMTSGILESVRWRNQKICLESHPIKSLPQSDYATIRAGVSVHSENLPTYSTSSVLSKVLEQATFDSDDDIDGRREPEKNVRSKKDLRFNIVPTVITEKEDDTYESPEKVISNLIREGIGIKVDSLSQLQHVTALTDAAGASMAPALSDRAMTASTSAEQGLRELTRSPVGQAAKLAETEAYLSRELQHQVNISTQPQTQAQSPQQPQTPQPQQPQQPPPDGAQNITQTQIENIYFKPQETGRTYRPLARDITLIAEEPEKEKAASMSKQSSMQSEEGTLDDTTESLDSGDSRRVSKVTSV